jgi:hypothetical protein
MIDITVEGLDPLLFRFKTAVDSTQEKVMTALEGAANDTIEIAKQIANQNLTNPGNYISSFYVQLGRWEVRFGNMHKWARAIESGTSVHIIKPKTASVLRFEKDGEVIYAKQVLHPGIKPRNIVGDAWRQYMPEFTRKFIEEVKI